MAEFITQENKDRHYKKGICFTKLPESIQVLRIRLSLNPIMIIICSCNGKLAPHNIQY